ncbi:MAG: hypothetical protein ACRDTG_18425 [Pseudonocardiaceae bacterium]
MAIIGAALCRVYAGRGAITALHTRLRDGDLSVELTHTGGEVSRVLLRPVKDTTGAASASHHAKGTRDVSGT